MHGIVFTELHRFVERSLGPEGWVKVLGSARLGNRVYMSVSDYPDADLVSIVEAASEIAHTSPAETLEAFGTFIAPDLLSMYSILVKPEWRTLDILEHTEAVIHTVVRVNQSGARPPELQCTRTGPDEIELRYDSPRRMCRFARGIIKGIAQKYRDNIEIVEYECMLRGSPACVIHIRNVR